MKMHPKAKEAFNKAAQELISIITEIKFPEKSKDDAVLSSSYKELQVIDLNKIGARLDTLWSHDADSGELCSICKFTEKGCFGIEGENIDKFSSLVKSIYKKTDWTTYDQLQKIVFQFIIDSYFTATEKVVTDFIEEYRALNAKTFTFYLIIKGMAIESSFWVGNVLISYTNREGFENLFKELKKQPQDWEKENMQKEFIGNTLAICGVQNCELEKAKEIALDMCLRSVNAIKIFSDVIKYPNRTVAFDLDSQFVEKGRDNKRLTLVFDDENPSHIIMGWGSKDNHPKTFEVRKLDIEEFELYGFAYVHNLLIRKDKNETCELEDIALEALSRFALALSNKDLHNRITEIFTSLESLILRNTDVGILDSLCKYIPKIVSKNLEERKKVQKGLKEMYAIRSAYIHHGKRPEINLNELKMLQIYLRTMILKFCILSSKYKTKNSILTAIDEAINEAF